MILVSTFYMPFMFREKLQPPCDLVSTLEQLTHSLTSKELVLVTCLAQSYLPSF
uniref:Uncharacterized protein n=1 Tax=Rhizophora mucronata TaxID=61149 RepID=A0A2P2Q4B4_RHIMU